MTDRNRSIGVVVIGRNEGERLLESLSSALRTSEHVVYVDSGSADNSTTIARNCGSIVVELDSSQPFTAARGRNTGINALCERVPEIEYVQVMDGDCTLVDGWIEFARKEISLEHDRAVVCGRRREKNRDASVYNALCDMEWNTPVGTAASCGGDALIRVKAFNDVGGFDDTIIAGEEPELCFRLRKAGWTIQRIDHDMTYHDARMTSFGQWWRRMVRSGHAYAEGWMKHRNEPGRFRSREVRSIVDWAFLLPAVALSLAWITWGVSMVLIGAYIVLWHRIRRHRIDTGDLPDDASIYAIYCVLGKFPQLCGVFMYLANRFRGKQSGIIEYKGVDDSQSPEQHGCTEVTHS